MGIVFHFAAEMATKYAKKQQSFIFIQIHKRANINYYSFLLNRQKS